ncbi:carbohydrate esterase family 16 protein [Auriculariales sp. MPI-PUGE-AT-0066]|nr:carbohydrate esterase family 16 protein [Auriculariales sp. MPI-PUGE-AT-0066]
MFLSTLPVFAALVLRQAAAIGAPHVAFKNLVTFGDSYTDVASPGDGGVAWPVYAAGYNSMALYPFAQSGAVCSVNLTPRPFPSVTEQQVPAFLAQLDNGTISINQHETIYTLWVGTNDVGKAALVSGNGMPGVSIVDTTTCAVNWVRTMYKAGARNFLFQNMIALEKTPMYSENAYYTRYWALERNATAWSVFIAELTKAGNAISRLMLQDLATDLPGAHVGLFDTHGLFTDIYSNPGTYLNGTDPLNVTGAVKSCVYQVNGTADTAQCTTVEVASARDSYLWYDELHPSEQADRVIAREIVAALHGNLTWTKWFS